MVEVEASETTGGQPNIHNVISAWYKADDARNEEYGTWSRRTKERYHPLCESWPWTRPKNYTTHPVTCYWSRIGWTHPWPLAQYRQRAVRMRPAPFASSPWPLDDASRSCWWKHPLPWSWNSKWADCCCPCLLDDHHCHSSSCCTPGSVSHCPETSCRRCTLIACWTEVQRW